MPKIDKTIARDGADQVQIEVHRTLPPVLKELKADGYTLVGLEQTTNSVSLHDYRFPRRTALVIGNERLGLTDEELRARRCRRRNPRLGPALRLQRRQRHRDGAVRILPAVAGGVEFSRPETAKDASDKATREIESDCVYRLFVPSIFVVSS